MGLDRVGFDGESFVKASSIRELKKSLALMDQAQLMEVCLRLTRFKVDNKELLTYLLDYSSDEQAYAARVCDAIDELFPDTGKMHKKTLRKIVRLMNKWIRYSGDKETELQVRIHFCQQCIDRNVGLESCRVKANLHATQIKKIDKVLEQVHPDLQFDFRSQMQGW